MALIVFILARLHAAKGKGLLETSETWCFVAYKVLFRKQILLKKRKYTESTEKLGLPVMSPSSALT